MVMVTISETYDVKTKVDKMTFLGIHTPKKELIQKMYPGLAMNCKYFRIDHVDVDIAAVSTLPLNPKQIGLDAESQVAPQDMLNPILYKAVSNDSWSTLESRLMGMTHETNADITSGNMAEVLNDSVTGLADEHAVYYSLLSNRDGFRMAGVQQGLSMHGLKPLVFDAWYNTGENGRFIADQYQALFTAADLQKDPDPNGSLKLGTFSVRAMRGRAHPMPRINTTYLTGVTGVSGEVQGTNYQTNGMADGTPVNVQIQMPDVPPVMLGAVVMPPMTNTPMWFRMVVRAYIEFTGIRPITEIAGFADMSASLASSVYHSNYASLSKNMDAKTDMVDGRGVEAIDKIMEGA